VTFIEAMDTLMPTFDPEIRRIADRVLIQVPLPAKSCAARRPVRARARGAVLTGGARVGGAAAQGGRLHVRLRHRGAHRMGGRACRNLS
jgi:hypothetical protein